MLRNMENAQEELVETTSAMPNRRTYTVPEAARLLGISRGQGYALARREELPGAIKLGGRTVVSRAVLDRVIDGEA
jgi:excisionase family DNA binding protein